MVIQIIHTEQYRLEPSTLIHIAKINKSFTIWLENLSEGTFNYSDLVLKDLKTAHKCLNIAMDKAPINKELKGVK